MRYLPTKIMCQDVCIVQYKGERNLRQETQLWRYSALSIYRSVGCEIERGHSKKSYEQLLSIEHFRVL
jgi:hypothetical protein